MTTGKISKFKIFLSFLKSLRYYLGRKDLTLRYNQKEYKTFLKNQIFLTPIMSFQIINLGIQLCNADSFVRILLIFFILFAIATCFWMLHSGNFEGSLHDLRMILNSHFSYDNRFVLSKNDYKIITRRYLLYSLIAVFLSLIIVNDIVPLFIMIISLYLAFFVQYKLDVDFGREEEFYYRLSRESN